MVPSIAMGNPYKLIVDEISARIEEADEVGVYLIRNTLIRNIINKHISEPERVTEVDGIVRTIGQAVSGEQT